MTDQQPSEVLTVGDVSPPELRTAMSGPAPFCDRFVVIRNQVGMRIAFLEKDITGAMPHFRGAVMLSYPDAIELRNLLDNLLKPIEPQIAEAVGKASGTAG
jgi:hypothetical protein